MTEHLFLVQIRILPHFTDGKINSTSLLFFVINFQNFYLSQIIVVNICAEKMEQKIYFCYRAI